MDDRPTIRVEPTNRLDPLDIPSRNGDASLGELFRHLAEDSRTLIQQEVALAKLELRDSVKTAATGAAFMGAGAGMLVLGLLVLTAFLVVGLGRLLGENYWLSSLIVGLVFAAAGAIAILSGKKKLQADTLKPEATVETIRENREWARAEAQQLKQDLTN